MSIKLIAEVGVNHCGSVKLAKQIIEAGINIGIKMFKFQIFNIDEFREKESWQWYDYMNHCALSFESYKELKNYCEKRNVVFFASAFGEQSLNIAKKLNIPIYKIASRSLFKNQKISPFASEIISLEKPVIASLGWYKDNYELPSFKNVQYLYCTYEYPTPIEKIVWPKFDDKIVGFSDHTIGIESAKEAIKRGAKIIEKHFTLDKNLYGPDHVCSTEPEEMEKLNELCVSSNGSS